MCTSESDGVDVILNTEIWTFKDKFETERKFFWLIQFWLHPRKQPDNMGSEILGLYSQSLFSSNQNSDMLIITLCFIQLPFVLTSNS